MLHILKFKRLLCSLALGISLLAGDRPVQAQLPYVDGDVLLGVRASAGDGASTNIVVNVGSIATFVNATGTITVNTGDLLTDLGTLYGTDWNTRGNVFWSVSGVQKVAGNGFPNNTMFATREEANTGTQTTPWVAPAAFGAGSVALRVQAFGSRYGLGATNDGGPQTVSTSNPKALLQATFAASSYTSFQPGGVNSTGGSSYGYFVAATGIEGSFENGAAYSVLDFYTLAPGSGNGVLIGAFRMNADGTLTFSKTLAPLTAQAAVRFDAETSSTSEASANAELIVRRRGDASTAFTVNFNTADGTAQAGQDYTGQTNFSVPFAASELEKTILVPLVDRPGFQGDRDFAGTITIGTGTAGLLSPSTVTVTIAENDPQPPTFAFSQATYTAAEDAGQVAIVINRTGGTVGAVSVELDTTNGTALAGTDYVGQTDLVVNFGNGVTQQTVNVPITDRPDFQPGRSFTVTLSNPSNAGTLGSPSTATVNITDTDTAPGGVYQFEAAAYTFGSKNGTGGPNTVSVVVTRSGDLSGTASVPVSATGGTLDAGDFTFTSPTNVNFANGEDEQVLNIPLTAAVSPLPGTIILQLGAPSSGTLGTTTTTTVTVVAPDTVLPKLKLTSPKGGKGQATFDVTGEVLDADPITRVEVKLNNGPVLNITPGAPSGGVTPFNLPGLNAENGPNTLLVQAFDNKGTASKVTRVVFTFINTNLNLTGIYQGIIVPTVATPPGADLNNATGLLTLTVTKTGTFTGKVAIGGAVLPISGVLANNGDARFKPALGTTFPLVKKGKTPVTFGDLSLSVATDVATGIKATGAIGATATIDAPRAHFDGKSTLLDPTLLENKGKYTVVLPSEVQVPPVDPTLYPQGDGVGVVTIAKTGKFSFVGSLADGAVMTASGPVSKNLKVALYMALYMKKGSIAGVVTVDKAPADSDMTGTNFLWVRPADSKAKQYAGGWPTGIKVDLMGAAYVVPDKTANVSVFPGLGAEDLTNGNATVTFEDGKITNQTPVADVITKNINITTKNKVTNAPATDKTFKVTLAAPTGAVSGFFTHSDGAKPKFKAVVYQQGPNAGAYGYFLSLQPKGGPAGEGGGVTILKK